MRHSKEGAGQELAPTLFPPPDATMGAVVGSRSIYHNAGNGGGGGGGGGVAPEMGIVVAVGVSPRQGLKAESRRPRRRSRMQTEASRRRSARGPGRQLSAGTDEVSRRR
ncbi:hypothetical protein GGTG_09496 [Gaeumannomyces tritici R3-111a-1]|uniref:Uncharacterized protein n=1 Tax=Gaeumannomyces tritici (strain R3-111a-1) TaxID=644352 RepID=J3P7K4_GAET3|nr:hypothetical protein GGTG_09496 [Gaeumannomyces tritici R3-111a-1]EJT72636.1 hypothetical protein GGTG_09496 [Gaeumannomyces tritici R3-111a-1]